MLDFERFKVLSFDCYGTLIDWERGIGEAMTPLLGRHGISVEAGRILELYGRFEREAEAQRPFVNYRGVLRQIVQSFGTELGFRPSAGELDTLEESLGGWPAFPDTVAALQELSAKYKLAIVSNVDLDLFSNSAETLQTRFEWVVSADMVGTYKPSREHFERLFEAARLPLEQHLHVAQSLYHDIGIANELGLASVWVNRTEAKSTPVVEARPDVEVPDLRSLAELVAGAG